MKLYRILKDFKGSQTGNDGPFEFTADTEAKLSDSLAAVVVAEGWAEPVPDKLSGGPHPKLEAEPDAPNVLIETKVTAPAETKPAKTFKKKK